MAKKKLRIALITLGCDKNTVDNEYLAGSLEEAGCELVLNADTDAASRLDAVVVTTCGFIAAAKEQSIDTILEWAERKRNFRDPQHLFVSGCLAQRYADELLKEIPEIDGVVGVGQFTELTRMISNGGMASRERNHVQSTPKVDIYPFMRRRRLDRAPHTFLKVSDGCNHACTFCTIPSMKGRLRSVAPEILLAEARGLINQGARELNLVAQDLADYGRDRGGSYRLPHLLRDLCRLDGDFWVRCLYVYPGGVTDEFLEVLAAEPKLVPYLDMPLQHLDAEVLKRMKRPYKEVNTFQLIERLRNAVPGMVLRTTMIVGFPGETEHAHENMLDGLRQLKFNWLGAFQYSQEEGTPAGNDTEQVSDHAKEERWRAVMEV
ncbi:MAG: MiaB/RimO family radical SAM methylthiotransferase, partial [Candidatus Hydrogenedentes bacterium]|nr:MiaB/RimO family radical SAM methylthiotransferase [Candidatus Hydrogenedentota bacterium]